MQPRLKDLPAACEHLTVSRAKLYNLIAAGEIKAVKIGRSTRFETADLDAFIDRLISKAA